jgi:hypothetical protein
MPNFVPMETQVRIHWDKRDRSRLYMVYVVGAKRDTPHLKSFGGSSVHPSGIATVATGTGV